ncbi:MAG: DUF998 domain-containing protein [Luteimonas sp.]
MDLPRAGLHAGWIAGALFAVALLAIAAATPGYEHAYQPVSFLGMRGAPLAAWWNMLGFGLPGALMAWFALALQRPLQAAGTGSLARIGTWLLLVSGLAFAGNGLFPFDPREPDGLSTKLHVTMLTVALLGFLPATAVLAAALRRVPGWRLLSTAGLLLGVATLLSVLQRMADAVPGLQDHPGYAQRVTLALYFLWLALAARIALRASTRARDGG